jgi:3'5'-cyclic nucleotide phosphodiesterase
VSISDLSYFCYVAFHFFSALVHDVGHYGVPNAVLVKERDPLALKFANRSVLEQNSVDIAWKFLMEPQFDTLRAQLCATEVELKNFRQVVACSVMATDIMDLELKRKRNLRYARNSSLYHECYR